MNPLNSDISASLPTPSPSGAFNEESQAGPAPDVLEMASRPWVTPAHEEIQTAAYHLYTQCGHQDGQAFDHWLAAESTLRHRGNESLDQVLAEGHGGRSHKG